MTDIQLTPHQREAYSTILSALSDPEVNVIILKGYAGTGKTTLLSFVHRYIREEMKKLCLVMAPTGRAAKVLREKVGTGQTIHRSIYSQEMDLKEVDSEDISKKSFKYVFHVRKSFDPAKVIIVDESSMISNMGGNNDILVFGSGKLLDDLLEFAAISSIHKLIFVGDDAQLPPVTDSRSLALDENFFTSKGYKVVTARLTEVVRQAGESGILKEATSMRTLLETPLNQRKEFKIKENGNDIIKEQLHRLPTLYTDLFPSPEVGDSAILCYSNSSCLSINRAIREILFPGKKEISVGDIIMIGSNSYGTFGRDIFNGDMAKVVSVGERRTTPNLKIWINKQEERVQLTFRMVRLMFPDDNSEHDCVIIEDMLDSPERDLTVLQQRGLYMDFILRMRDEGIMEKSEKFRLALKSDLFFNALKVKYGYAITCHKAQGGEWNTVFANYSGKTGLSDDNIRWCYTATTRAEKRLYIVNPPTVSFSGGLSFTQITGLAKSPSEFWGKFEEVDSPFHSPASPQFLKMKCQGVIEALSGTPYTLKNVISYNYMERYVFDHLGQEITLDCWYDNGGAFKHLQQNGDGSPRDILCEIFNNAFHIPEKTFEFKDENKGSLYQRVNAAAIEAGMRITNVIDNTEKHFMQFFFICPDSFSTIKFFFSKGRLSKAMPQSSIGNNDKRLSDLIEILS